MALLRALGHYERKSANISVITKIASHYPINITTCTDIRLNSQDLSNKVYSVACIGHNTTVYCFSRRFRDWLPVK